MAVLTDLVENTPYALADFMEHEKIRCCIDLSPEGHLLPHGGILGGGAASVVAE